MFKTEILCWKFHINYVSMKKSKIGGIIAKARHTIFRTKKFKGTIQYHGLCIPDLL